MVKEKAKATIIALLCSGTIGIVMAYNGMAFWGLAVQQITYISIANALLWHFSQWRPTFHLISNPSERCFRSVVSYLSPMYSITSMIIYSLFFWDVLY